MRAEVPSGEGRAASNLLMPSSSPLQPATKPEHHRFHLLDGLRGIAAIIVLMLHAPPQYASHFQFQNSSLAVDFFFCLSGFVIAFSYERRLSSFLNLRAFAVARIIRLYPLAALGTTTGALLTILGFHNHGRVIFGNSLIIYLLLGLLVVPSTRYDVLFPLNPVTWTLFFELLANFVYAALVHFRLAKSRAIFLLSAMSMMLLAALGKHFGAITLGFSAGTAVVGLARVGVSFFVGVLVCRLYKSSAPRKVYGIEAAISATFITAAFCLVFFCPWKMPHIGYADLLAIGIIFPFLVYISARVVIPRRWVGTCTFLGTISYPLYVLHDVLLEPLYESRALAFATMHHTLAIFVMLGTLFILIVTAWLAANFFDAHIRSILTRRFGRILDRKPLVSAQGVSSA